MTDILYIPVAWAIYVRDDQTDWRRYSMHDYLPVAERAVERMSGPPLQFQIVPLYHDPRAFTADAITKLRTERDNAIAECLMHIGNAKALRAERDEWHNVATAAGLRVVDIRAERDALQADLAAARALLNEAQGFIVPDTAWDYTTDAGGYLYDRIDAALKDKP